MPFALGQAIGARHLRLRIVSLAIFLSTLLSAQLFSLFSVSPWQTANS